VYLANITYTNGANHRLEHWPFKEIKISQSQTFERLKFRDCIHRLHEHSRDTYLRKQGNAMEKIKRRDDRVK
jgi:hypothetical protein